MKAGSIYMLGILALLLAGCGSRYEYWDISKFNMDNQALEDYEEVIILYTSRGPDFNRDLNYYIHLIAVSQKTGDTVNILTTSDNGITMKDKDKVFNFFNQDNIASRIIQMDLEDIENIPHIDDLNSKPSKKIDKVARDRRFDHIADNNYPTIIGFIGTTKNNIE